MNAIKTSLIILFVCLSVAGCKGKTSNVASVNGRDITQGEFEAYLKLKHVAPADSKRRAAALDEYLERTAMASLLEKEGKFDKVAIEAEVEEFRKELLISRYFDQFLADKVSEAAIKNYYDSHAADYEQRKVHVAHILVRTQPKMAEAEKQAKRTTLQEIYSKLQSGQAFEELAKSASEDRISGAKGGDLGWLREGAIDPEFSKRAFAGKAGSITEPFETPFGFHILKVIEEPKISRKPFGAAAGDIRYQLRSETKAAEIKRLKELAKIKKFDGSSVTSSAVPSASAAPQPLPVPTQPRILPSDGTDDSPLGIAQPTPAPQSVQTAPSNRPAAVEGDSVKSGATKEPTAARSGVTAKTPPSNGAKRQ